jgi:hypothetical protein
VILFSDLQEGMGMGLGLFASLAEIEVWTDTALVSNASNWGHITAITSHFLMHFLLLLLSLLSQVLANHSLELLSGEGFDLFTDNLIDILHVLVLHNSCSIAFSARQSL